MSLPLCGVVLLIKASKLYICITLHISKALGANRTDATRETVVPLPPEYSQCLKGACACACVCALPLLACSSAALKAPRG